MRLLLDSHILLWWLEDNKQLSLTVKEHIAKAGNIVLVSAASIWELRIKQHLGKLKLPESFTEDLSMELFESLPITTVHAHAVADLPFHHRDPFDRMLIAQAQSDRLTIVTHDRMFSQYQVDLILND